ncbi:MAG: hypothetical protein ACYTGV_04825 [Planctomycetota bacterium]|jgi:hypothetical protein
MVRKEGATRKRIQPPESGFNPIVIIVVIGGVLVLILLTLLLLTPSF